jgi:hypothetical protein
VDRGLRAHNAHETFTDTVKDKNAAVTDFFPQHHVPHLGTEKSPSVQEFEPTKLSPMVIKAIYAHQMQLDALLPPRISAHCRLWAEDRFVASVLRMNLTGVCM